MKSKNFKPNVNSDYNNDKKQIIYYNIYAKNAMKYV